MRTPCRPKGMAFHLRWPSWERKPVFQQSVSRSRTSRNAWGGPNLVNQQVQRVSSRRALMCGSGSARGYVMALTVVEDTPRPVRLPRKHHAPSVAGGRMLDAVAIEQVGAIVPLWCS